MSQPQHLRVDPIRDDDAAIAAALEDTSTPALVAAVALATGDPTLLRGPVRPRKFLFDEFQGALPEAERDRLRAAAFEAIRGWRDAGSPPPPPPDDDLVREAMHWIACKPVRDDYAALYLEEMDLAGRNPRRLPLPAAGARPDVIVIGCGEAGLLAAIRLREAGVPFEVLEKNDDVGGTWLENTYPGCRVDVASQYYSFSFGPQDFGEYFARRPELHAYFRRLLDEHEIGPHVRWGSEVERAEWDEAAARWVVTVRRRDGGTETRTAAVLISGVGILNRPFVPDLPGLADFAGPAFHSARWDHTVDLRGRRVALIGAGASGFQIGPAIADEVARLVVFQRTPQWMAPNPRYHQPVRPGERWAVRHLPGYAQWLRFMIMYQSSDRLLDLVRVDETWEDFPRTANAASAARREVFAGWIESLAGDDPELLAKVMPDYPPMSKRMLQDDGTWLRTLARPHVELVRDPITRIGPGAVETAGAAYEVDVAVLATGFRAAEVLWPMRIVGRGGRSLADVWDGHPAAYAGVSVPGFPNFFVLNGPGTGLAHAGSVIVMTECQMRYVGDALRQLVEGGHRTVEPTPEAYERYRRELQDEVGTLMWGHPSIRHSWYKSADGGVDVLCPWPIVEYWQRTAAAVPADHVLT